MVDLLVDLLVGLLLGLLLGLLVGLLLDYRLPSSHQIMRIRINLTRLVRRKAGKQINIKLLKQINKI